jgi:hypothetical protein
MNKREFKTYCGLADYFAGVSAFCSSVMAEISSKNEAIEVVDATYLLMVHEFYGVEECIKHYYIDLKDNKEFFNWNSGFVATAHIHHKDDVLDKTCVPIL